MSKKAKNIIFYMLLVLFIAGACVCGYFLFSYFHASHENEEMVSSLKDMIEEDDTEGESVHAEENAEPLKVVVDERWVLKKYAKLYEQNHDFVGWISIEDTNIDYPVVHCPNNEQKYLRKNFYGEYALAGTPFMAGACDPMKPSTNLIIYGHNMQDNTMFGGLSDYADQSFYEAHKIIRFDTIYDIHHYEVIAAFHTTVQSSTGQKLYNFIMASSEEKLNDVMQSVRKDSEIETNFDATMNDHFLTLSTCDDSGAATGHRFLVVAKQID